jgi:hypothetical protein
MRMIANINICVRSRGGDEVPDKTKAPGDKVSSKVSLVLCSSNLAALACLTVLVEG